jgi:hypothetical protein
MTTPPQTAVPLRTRLFLIVWAPAAVLTLIGCSATQSVVENTTKTISKTTHEIARNISLSDEDLKRKVGIFNFENNTLRASRDFQNIFHKGLPEYVNDSCPGIIVANTAAGGLFNTVKRPPKLPSGLVDGFALTMIGRQLGLNAIVTGSLEDIRIINELQGVLWTKDTHHLVQVFIRVEVFETRTATKILDNTFERQIEIDDLEYRLIREKNQIKLPELNETLKELLSDIGDSVCEAVRDQPWDGYITQIDGQRYVISSGTRIGLQPGDILEVYDSSRIMEGVGGQRFFIPGQKIGEIQIVTATEDRTEAERISGESIKMGSAVRRKD